MKNALPILLLINGALLAGCGIGLCADPSGSCHPVASGPRLLLSGLEGLSIRKNDCYPVNISAVDADGNAMTAVEATAVVAGSSGVVFYSSLLGCETYNADQERSTYSLTASSPSATFYFRCDVDGQISLRVSTSADVGLASAIVPLSVQFGAYANAEGPNRYLTAIAQDTSGRTYIGGSFSTFGKTRVNYIARLNFDGSLDSSFLTTGTGLNGDLTALLIQPDGKIVVGGYFTSYNGTARTGVARLNADGSLDPSFALTGTGLDGSVLAVALEPDGQVLVGGLFSNYNSTARSYIARLNPDGSLDSGFVQTGTGIDGQVTSISIQADGKVLAAGDFTAYDAVNLYYIARLNNDGSLDGTFGPVGTGLDGQIYTTAIQPDGKILVGGDFVNYDVTTQSYVARLNADGSLDPSFVTTGAGLDTAVNSISLQVDGRVIIGGHFTSYNGTLQRSIARLNANGSLDSSFAPPGGAFNNPVFNVFLQSNGQVIAGGNFTAFDGAGRSYLARLNSNGSLDTSFGPVGSGLDSYAFSIVQQADGKTIVGGAFTSYGGSSRPYVLRLAADGSLDASFAAVGTGLSSSVRALSVQSDGKLLVGGDFGTYNGTSRPRLARLNSAGGLDTTFSQSGTGLNSTVQVISVQADGKILVGGGFTSYNGTSRRRVARINVLSGLVRQS